MPHDNARFVAILAAVALPVAIRIGANYLEQPIGATNGPTGITHAAATPDRTTGVPPQVAVPAGIPRERAIEDSLAAQRPTASPGAVHKCRVQGQITYSDQPCSPGSNLKSFTPSLAAVPVVVPVSPTFPRSRSAPQEQPAGEMRSAELAPATDVAGAEKARRVSECRLIDERITAIDAILRQPYHPATGDRLKEERKALNDRRFALGC